MLALAVVVLAFLLLTPLAAAKGGPPDHAGGPPAHAAAGGDGGPNHWDGDTGPPDHAGHPPDHAYASSQQGADPAGEGEGEESSGQLEATSSPEEEQTSSAFDQERAEGESIAAEEPTAEPDPSSEEEAGADTPDDGSADLQTQSVEEELEPEANPETDGDAGAESDRRQAVRDDAGPNVDAVDGEDDELQRQDTEDDAETDTELASADTTDDIDDTDVDLNDEDIETETETVGDAEADTEAITSTARDVGGSLPTEEAESEPELTEEQADADTLADADATDIQTDARGEDASPAFDSNVIAGESGSFQSREVARMPAASTAPQAIVGTPAAESSPATESTDAGPVSGSTLLGPAATVLAPLTLLGVLGIGLTARMGATEQAQHELGDAAAQGASIQAETATPKQTGQAERSPSRQHSGASQDDEEHQAIPEPGVSGMLSLAQRALDRGQVEVAAGWFQTATELDPRQQAAHFCLGLCFEKMGRLQAAEAALAEALRLAPEDLMAAYAHAGVLARQGRTRKAVTELERVVTKAPAIAEMLSGDDAWDGLSDHPRLLALTGEL